jgi:RNA polymerase sigma-70 factor (ECF subfamily)
VRVPRIDVDEEAFDAFVAKVEPRLRGALTALRGVETGQDATSEALAWAWVNWARVKDLEHPVGYLVRVGRTRTRPRLVRTVHAREPAEDLSHRAEPRLARALSQLPEQRRAAILLVHGYGWTHQEVADALGVSRSSVGTHIERAMTHLRNELGAHHG